MKIDEVRRKYMQHLRQRILSVHICYRAIEGMRIYRISSRSSHTRKMKEVLFCDLREMYTFAEVLAISNFTRVKRWVQFWMIRVKGLQWGSQLSSCGNHFYVLAFQRCNCIFNRSFRIFRILCQCCKLWKVASIIGLQWWENEKNVVVWSCFVDGQKHCMGAYANIHACFLRGERIIRAKYLYLKCTALAYRHRPPH